MTFDELVDREQQKLLANLAVDFFVEAIANGPDDLVSAAVDAYKAGNDPELAICIKDLVRLHAEQTAAFRWGK